MIKLYSQKLKTPVGVLRVAGSSLGLCRISFPVEPSRHWSHWFERYFSQLPEEHSAPLLSQTLEQLRAYFEGDRRRFRLRLDLRGTPFQLRVWEQLLKIPYGGTVSYGEIATRIRQPRACQAVGAAVGSNPVPVVVPCHRVVGHDGSLVGFGGGLPAKEKLLELEGARIPFS